MLRYAATACQLVGFADVVCLLATGNLWHLASACAAFALANLLRDFEADEADDERLESIDGQVVRAKR